MARVGVCLVILLTLILYSGCTSTNADDAAVQGEAIFKGAGACNTCHDVSSGVVIVGPSLKGIASRAGQRIQGVTAEAYIVESIVTPNAYIVPGFQANVMPKTYSERLTEDQVNALVAYLMTLK